MGFLYFTPMAHQPFLSTVSTSSKLPINLLVVQSPLHLGMPIAFSLFHYPFHDRFQFIWFYHEPFPPCLNG